ncbi:MAG: TldD/PmbA family protein [Woeseiaceae bacterium]|nr:TldD/PmbA family protein [Woeseiaceae bacterium]
MSVDRRDFLRRALAGGAVLGAPALLPGCAVLPAVTRDPGPAGNPFFARFAIDESTLTRLMSALTARGADTADIYFQHATRNDLVLDGGGPVTATTTVIRGAGFRVMRADRAGYASTEELTMPAMLAAANRAAAAVGGAAVPPAGGWLHAAAGDRYVTGEAWSDVVAARKRPVLERVDTLARKADPRVGNVTVTWDDVDEHILVATSDGRIVTDRRPLTRMSVQVTAVHEGVSHDGYASVSARDGIDWYTYARVDAMTRDAVERALVQFDARRPPAGEMPVLLAAGASGVILHEAVGHALEADFLAGGVSPYTGRLGETVASREVTVIDDAMRAHERGALNYDDEGTACGRTVLIDEGRLTSFLHDRRTARLHGTTTTGSARRESFRHAPMPRMTCTFMANGTTTAEALQSDMRRGILAETSTGGSVDIGAGNFEFQVKNGWLIENGRRTVPIRDVRILGNGPDMLASIAGIANDGRLAAGGWTCGKHGQRVPVSHGMPTVLVNGLRVDTGPVTPADGA